MRFILTLQWKTASATNIAGMFATANHVETTNNEIISTYLVFVLLNMHTKWDTLYKYVRAYYSQRRGVG